MDRPTTLAVASLVFLAWWSAAAAFNTIGTYPPGNDVPRILHYVSFCNNESAQIKLLEREWVATPGASFNLQNARRDWVFDWPGFGSWWRIKLFCQYTWINYLFESLVTCRTSKIKLIFVKKKSEYGFLEKKVEHLTTKPKQNCVRVNDSNDKQLNQRCLSNSFL